MPPANTIWNAAVLEAGDDPFDIAAARPIKIFSSKRLRTRYRAVHTQADPFLFVDGGWLYLFLEVQRVGEQGHIAAHRTRDLVTWEALGPILTTPHHLSYPLIFRDGDAVHMLPETSEANEVALYTFGRFPDRIRKERVLLSGRYDDPTIFHDEGLWWLFATRDGALELFFSPRLSAPFKRHPQSPLTSDPAYARCGGPVIAWRDGLYRLAQDGTEQYGGNLNVLRITALTPTVYREEPARAAIFDRAASWRAKGAHHFSIARFMDRTIIATDGKQNDFAINRYLSGFLKILS